MSCNLGKWRHWQWYRTSYWCNMDKVKACLLKLSYLYLRTKKYGGLNIKNCKLWNIVVAVKLLWQLESKKNVMWVNWILYKEHYANITSRLVDIWRSWLFWRLWWSNGTKREDILWHQMMHSLVAKATWWRYVG